MTAREMCTQYHVTACVTVLNSNGSSRKNINNDSERISSNYTGLMCLWQMVYSDTRANIHIKTDTENNIGQTG